MSHGMLQVMPRFPRVVGAGAIALEHEGVALGPLSVELWDDRVVVRVAGVPIADASRRREAQFREAHREWAHDVVRAQKEGEDLPDGPLHPLGEVLEVL